jgi:hypothetical protein
MKPASDQRFFKENILYLIFKFFARSGFKVHNINITVINIKEITIAERKIPDEEFIQIFLNLTKAIISEIMVTKIESKLTRLPRSIIIKW